MAFSFDSIGERIVSFKAATNADVGYPCAVTDNDTVGEPADQGDIIGVVRSVRNGIAGVVVSGCITLRYTGTAPTCGYQTLGYDNDTSSMKVISGCKSYLVVHVDTTEKTVTFFL